MDGTPSRLALHSTERRLRSSRVKHTLAGATLGLLAGAAIGGITAAAAGEPCSTYSDGFYGRGVGILFGTFSACERRRREGTVTDLLIRDVGEKAVP